MDKLILGLVIIFISSFVVSSQNCKYDKDGVQNPPFVWMWNKLESKTVQQITGIVVDVNNEPVPNTTIALFQKLRNKYIFIGSLDTDDSRRFCFKRFRKGKYFLKVGNKGFQGFDIEIDLDHKNKEGLKELQFTLEIGY